MIYMRWTFVERSMIISTDALIKTNYMEIQCISCGKITCLVPNVSWRHINT